MYHDVLPESAVRQDPYSLRRGELEQTLDIILELGLRSSTIDEVLDEPLARQGEAGRVVLSFDDARCGVLDEAFPLLEAREMVGVVYSISGRVSRPGHLDPAGLAVLADASWTVGSHGFSHRHLSGLGLAELREEWRRSRADLEALLDREVRHASLPGGRGGRREAIEAQRAGFRSLATSLPALWRSPHAPYAIPRFPMRAGCSPAHVARLLRHELRALLPERLRHEALRQLKRILGDPTYDRIRKAILGAGAGEEG